MKGSPIYIGKTEYKQDQLEITGNYLDIEGESFYKISNYDQMRSFFMTIVSDSDHWMFISSNGALTAGRKNPDNAIFPYYSDDKIHDSADLTGSKTIILAEITGKTSLWEPFSDKYEGAYSIRRNIYKNMSGNKLIFEEINTDLSLTFCYSWTFSGLYGFVRKSWIENSGSEVISIDMIDGIQNILPYGVNLGLQTEVSTLVDAYKKNELLTDTGLGIYRLSSIPVDKAEPSEALIANTVWSYGFDDSNILLCSLQLDRFRKGHPVIQEENIRAERGAYFINCRFKLDAGQEKSSYLVAEVCQDSSEVAALNHMLKNPDKLESLLNQDIEKGTENLNNIVASSDGMQLCGNDPITARHFSNVLFNVMRGGIFDDNYTIDKTDFLQFIKDYNRKAADKHKTVLNELPIHFSYSQLLDLSSKTGDADLIRLTYEYMPITFSRRHGDPSRPWNKFSIEVKADDGSKVLYYQGNWRDIFQNWEALSLAYPGFIESMISKFVNASTIDGYNPYRITRDGIDWEVVEPNDPWSYIGYWGDHQVIYLLKLLEISQKYNPEALDNLLSQRIFSFANVPYRIKSYEDLLNNPFDTVDFDDELEATIHTKVDKIGADGKMILDQQENVFTTNLIEKLLIPVLIKFTNFIPEGGIWLNTQRPEWNDANNALVGRGVSMVTLYYMYRYQIFLRDLLKNKEAENFEILVETAELLSSITKTFLDFKTLLSNPFSDTDRKSVLDQLGKAGSSHRNKIYADGPSGKTETLNGKSLLDFINISIKYISHTIAANKRADGLYHAYNLMTVSGDKVTIDYLYEMLEGQVAVLSSGILSGKESLAVLHALKQSALYRTDQHSYILYPDRKLASFVEKNLIPQDEAENSKLIQQLIGNSDRTLVEKDILGCYHFNGNFRNANDVKKALDELKSTDYSSLVENEYQSILDLFEKMFDHKSFTGRSGTFFGYEGLGSIYWHMVSKLLLAAQESCFAAIKNKEPLATIDQLIECYYDIRAGIGFNKTPSEYGAFPSDAYSHTPGNAGAQQPGMTGQVKEDILARFGELGVVVETGQISFQPFLLQESEFLSRASSFTYYDIHRNKKSIEMEAGQLAFTFCQVPIVYTLSDKVGIKLTSDSGVTTVIESDSISASDSNEIFQRTGKITLIEVDLNPGLK